MKKKDLTRPQDYIPALFCAPGWGIEKSFIIEAMERCDAVWVHDGNPDRPHAELTSGACSNGFFNCLKVLKHVNLNEIFAYHLASKIRKEIGDIKVDWVIGSPMAGIVFSYAVARHIKADVHMFTEKDPEKKGGMLWRREVIPEGASVLQIEELITKATTLTSVREAVDRDNPYPVNWIPVVGTFVHRPAKLPITHYGDRKVIALLEQEVWVADPPCELCKAGSPRYKPKANWDKLTK